MCDLPIDLIGLALDKVHELVSDIGDGATGLTATLKTGANSFTHYGILELASESGVGYSHGSSPLAGGVDMYMATIGYRGPAKVSTPICSDEPKLGDAPCTMATGKISGHRTDCTSATELLDALKSRTAIGEDCAIPTMRMLHGANMYWSSALVSCVDTLV